jgi:type VI secretion system secreted protein Hcp
MAVDYHLKLDGITGESQIKGHESEIQLHSWSWGGHQVSSVRSGSGSGAGKVDMADFNVMKNVDKATTPLFKALVTGSHIASGILTAVKTGSGGKPFLTITMKELLVTSLQVSASSEIPTESVSFSYNEVKHEYSTQNAQGAMNTTGSTTFTIGTNTAS